MDEAATHPHNQTRQVFGEMNGVMQPAPAPRFDGEMPKIPETNMSAQDYDAILARENMYYRIYTFYFTCYITLT